MSNQPVAAEGGNPSVAIEAVAGNPDDEEVVAIVAALEIAWPRPAAAAGVNDIEPPRWRFSGRHWSTPIPRRRLRP